MNCGPNLSNGHIHFYRTRFDKHSSFLIFTKQRHFQIWWRLSWHHRVELKFLFTSFRNTPRWPNSTDKVFLVHSLDFSSCLWVDFKDSVMREHLIKMIGTQKTSFGSSHHLLDPTQKLAVHDQKIESPSENWVTFNKPLSLSVSKSHCGLGGEAFMVVVLRVVQLSQAISKDTPGCYRTAVTTTQICQGPQGFECFSWHTTTHHQQNSSWEWAPPGPNT